jgi:CubicO group peptidase (beta-lactamase class C family)
MEVIRALSTLVVAGMAAGIMSMSSSAQAADPLPRGTPEEVGMSSERLALIGKAVNAEIARDQLPGAVLAIARRGKLVYFETFGYRDKAAGAPMSSDAIFSIASMTKPMVAVGALQLYEQGKLLMDDPVAKYRSPSWTPGRRASSRRCRPRARSRSRICCATHRA